MINVKMKDLIPFFLESNGVACVSLKLMVK